MVWILLLTLCVLVVAGTLTVGLYKQQAEQNSSGISPKNSVRDQYVHSVVDISESLLSLLHSVDHDPSVEEAVKVVNISKGSIDEMGCDFPISHREIVLLVAMDLILCYQRLGYSMRASWESLEMLGLAIPFSYLFIEEGKIRWLDYSHHEQNQIVDKLSVMVREFDKTVRAEEREDELAFCFVFSKNELNLDFVKRYSVLLYRWASLLAKVDGTISFAEVKWLTEIMRQGGLGENGNASRRPASGGVSRGDPCDRPLEALETLTGLEPVKEQVRILAQLIAVNAERRKQGMRVAPLSLHCVFTGNPGTGKTTVARILAGIYRDLGVLKKGHLVETDRSGLVAEYVGQTAVKTNKVVDSALDGILFVDEAYALASGDSTDFGREAISTLLKRMEDDRDRLVVVLAGYTGDMERFISTNPGLRSRFGRFIEFPDYTAEELVKIFLSFATKNQYVCTAGASQALRKRLEKAVTERDADFGNARYVRNLFERAIEHQATRLSGVAPLTKEILEQISTEDIESI